MFEDFVIPLTDDSFYAPSDIPDWEMDFWLRDSAVGEDIHTAVIENCDLPTAIEVFDLTSTSMLEDRDNQEYGGEISFNVTLGEEALTFSGVWSGRLKEGVLRIDEIWIDEGFGVLTDSDGQLIANLWG